MQDSSVHRLSYYNYLTDEKLLSGIWNLLCKYSNQFVPPLWSRKSTLQDNLNDALNSKDLAEMPYEYFEDLKKQSVILATDIEGQVIGFMSFQLNFWPSALCNYQHDESLPVYVTTVIIDEAYRKIGLATEFYKEIFKHDPSNKIISVRTWSTNYSHIKLLNRLDFIEAYRIENDRGQGLDTIYYIRKCT